MTCKGCEALGIEVAHLRALLGIKKANEEFEEKRKAWKARNELHSLRESAAKLLKASSWTSIDSRTIVVNGSTFIVFGWDIGDEKKISEYNERELAEITKNPHEANELELVIFEATVGGYMRMV